LPFQKINHLSEADTVLYAPILHVHQKRPGEVALVMVPEKRDPSKPSLLVTDPRPADKPQEWKVPETISLAAFVYGPQGLSKRKVQGFLSQDDMLIAQLADYAAKTAQTEALIEALDNSGSSSASVNAALTGFASQYGLSVQLDKTAPPTAQAQALFAVMNPQLATYNPLASSAAERVGQTASLAAAAATLFFGSPIGLAAGGTAMLLDLRSIAFPGTQFRSSFAENLPTAGVNLCGQRTPTPPHTRVAYIWATRIPNTPVPTIQIGSANFIPLGQKTPVPVEVPDPEWKYLQRARNWALQSATGSPVAVKVLKLGNQKALEINLDKLKIVPGSYTLKGYWDWSQFQASGALNIRPLSNFADARLAPHSQDQLVTASGKIAATVEGSDFEFVEKAQIKRVGDEFAVPEAVRFILPKGMREGPQPTMDVQIDTADIAPGPFDLILTQQDNKPHNVPFRVLPEPPVIENLPVLANEGAGEQHYQLKGKRLDLIARLEAPGALFTLGQASANGFDLNLTIQLQADEQPGRALNVLEYLKDRTAPVTLSDGLQITGPLPVIASSKLSVPAGLQIALLPEEFPAGYVLSALLDVKNMNARSTLHLGCADDVGPTAVLHVGEQTATSSLTQLSQDQVFVSLDTTPLPSGCAVQAVVDNGRSGASAPYTLARIVRLPQIYAFSASTPAPANAAPTALESYSLTGKNLELIAQLGWSAASPSPVTALPTPVPGQGQTETLKVTLPPPLAPNALLLLWLRGETQPRATTIVAPAAAVRGNEGDKTPAGMPPSPALDERPLETKPAAPIPPLNARPAS
jgi:hypothetical protein